MKTIEEKVKAYDEALERARSWIKDECEPSTKKCLELLFPELRESKDERILKCLEKIVNWGCAKNISAEYGVELKDVKSWLEKQKKIIDSITASRITIRPDGGIERPTIGYLEKQKGNQYFVGYAKGYSEGQLNPKQKEQKPSIFPPGFGEVKWNPISPSSVKQKPAWSEEDESILNNIIAYRYLNVDDLEWIKKLPKRFNLQPKQEWSEEDIEAFVKSYSDSLPMCGEFQLYHDALVHAYRQGVVNTLKSLRPSWKPSEEQIESLRWIIDNSRPNTEHETLCSLLDDLLKLNSL
jgi:hypothetical protein